MKKLVLPLTATLSEDTILDTLQNCQWAHAAQFQILPLTQFKACAKCVSCQKPINCLVRSRLALLTQMLPYIAGLQCPP